MIRRVAIGAGVGALVGLPPAVRVWLRAESLTPPTAVPAAASRLPTRFRSRPVPRRLGGRYLRRTFGPRSDAMDAVPMRGGPYDGDEIELWRLFGERLPTELVVTGGGGTVHYELDAADRLYQFAGRRHAPPASAPAAEELGDDGLRHVDAPA